MEKNKLNLTDMELSAWRTRLHSLRYSCGCESGMIALLLAFIFSLYYFLYAHGSMYSQRQKILYIIFICLGFALAGKVIGIGFTRIKYYKLKKKLIKMGIPHFQLL